MSNRSKWRKLMSRKRYRGDKDPVEDTIQEVRGAFFKDADRIIYSSPFRRLQDKTQVHPFPGTDYIRTRLTHSLEVSTVGRSLGLSVGDHLVKKHNLNSGANAIDRSDFGGVVAAACLAHDIGTPPFGHAGEEAIRHWFLVGENSLYCQDISEPASAFDLQMFEGNAQGFRLLTRLAGWREKGGLRISCATLGAFMKYPCGSLAIDPETGQKSPRKKFGYFQQDKDAFCIVADTLGLKKVGSDPFHRYRHPLAYLVEAADDICYLIADLEDGLKYHKLSYERVRALLMEISSDIIGSARLRSIKERSDKIAYLRAKAIGVLIEEVITVFLDNEDKIIVGKIEGSLLDNIRHKDTINSIRRYCTINLYKDRAKLISELAGFEVISYLLKIFATSFLYWECEGCKVDDLPPRYQKVIRLLPGYEKLPKVRYEWLLRVTDYISGMADRYALAQFQNLKGIHIETGRN